MTARLDSDRIIPSAEVEALAAALLKGDRRMLPRAITLVESTRFDHRQLAEALIETILPRTGTAIRLGITGTPGVGKSTFIEALGMYLTDLGKKVAVLAIDPSSVRSGGSILGDKTRMERLSRDPNAFIRSSPAGRTLGGVAQRTREAMLLVEATGFDVVLVETVGVGQSETAVADMVDMFLLLLAPAGGDELQGIKRGIMELADLVIVNKADGDLTPAARLTAADYTSALRLMRPKYTSWTPRVVLASALTNMGIDKIWATVIEQRTALEKAGDLTKLRAGQARSWLWSEIGEGLTDVFKSYPAVAAILPELEQAVSEGRMSPSMATRQLMKAFKSTV